MEKAKSLNHRICEYISANPLCYTKDIAEAFNTSSQVMAKTLNILEGADYVRAIKVSSRRNIWIRGTNESFKRAGGGTNAFKGNGGIHYPTTGFIKRKRLATITVSANDALALLSKGFSRLEVA